MEIVQGDLIKMAMEGNFDAIAHGCNCFCTQKAGIAAKMSMVFETNNPSYYKLEEERRKGDFHKLGNIEGVTRTFFWDNSYIHSYIHLYVINCYTQYNLGKALDYDALTMCMKKINHYYKGLHIGLPQIGCGIAGGSWSRVKEILNETLTNVKVTVVEFNG